MPGVSLAWTHPLAQDLVARYFFNEGAGAGLFNLATDKHAALVNMDPQTDWVGSDRGGALDFDGVDDHCVGVGSVHGLGAASITVRFRTTAGQVVKSLVSFSHAAGGAGFAIRLESATQIACVAITSGTNGLAVATVAYTDGAWHEVVGTYDNGTTRLYFDGVLVATDTAGAGTITASDALIYVGARSTTGGFAAAQIDEVRAYRRALTAGDAAALSVEPYADTLFSPWSWFLDRTHAAIEIEAALEGLGNGWTDLTADLLWKPDLNLSYGIQGAGPLDLTAAPGRLSFALNNSDTNSAGLVGYYSPGHLNCRAGFGIGTWVRARFNLPGQEPFFKLVGRLKRVAAVSGVHGERKTLCLAQDWLAEAAQHQVNIPTQVGRRFDECLATVIDAMPTKPISRQFDVGDTTFRYAFDNSDSAAQPALTEFQRLAMSEPGSIYMKGDRTEGGRLRAEKRSARYAPVTIATFDNLPTAALDAPVDHSKLRNMIQVTAHPRLVDASAKTVLYSDPGHPEIEIGATLKLTGRYNDPTNRAVRVGGIDMQSPAPVAITSSSVANPTVITTATPHNLSTGDDVVIYGHSGSTPNINGVHTVTVTGASTFTIPVNVTVGGTGGAVVVDYRVNTAEDGSGTDLTQNVSMVAKYGANMVEHTLVNSSGSPGFITKRQARGRGLRDYNAFDVILSDAVSIQLHGEALLQFDMPHQHGGVVARTVAAALLSRLNNPRPVEATLRYTPVDDAGRAVALGLEVGDAIRVADTVTGVDATFYVQRVSLRAPDENVLVFDWLLSLALVIPTVQSFATSFVNSDGTSHVVSLPAGITPGDLLIVAFSVDGVPSITWPTGWTQFATGDAPASAQRTALAYRRADGTEVSTITVTVGAAQQSSHMAWRIVGAANPAVQPPEASAAAVGDSGNPNPNPSALTPTGGTKNYLWLAIAGCDDINFIEILPDGYGGAFSATSGTANGTSIGGCYKTKFAASEDPEPAMFFGSSWVAFTVAVHPM